jgi:hypothetical protein
LVNWKGLEEPYGLFSELVCDIWGQDKFIQI